jgi:geranylgeranyl reductase family protein
LEIMNRKCDILVVGAGPAGTSAALAAARSGARVLIAERKGKIGLPVRCGEYIPAPLVGEIGLGRSFVVQSVKGMRTIVPGGEINEMRAPGFVTHRDIFDQVLADAAKEAGAEIQLSTRVISKDDGRVLLKGSDGKALNLEPGAIIGADGPHSTVGKWIGYRNRKLIPAIQARVSLCRPMNFTEVYFDKEIYGGYGWLFPKGEEANVGLGITPKEGNSASLRKSLDRFIAALKAAGKIKGMPYELTAGWIPAEPMKETVKGNVALVGDAAGQTHPITGAGIHQAIVCGRMAGKHAAQALGKGKLSLLSEYDIEWHDLFGHTLERAYERRQLLEGEWDRLDEIIKYCWIAYREYYSGTFRKT